MFWEGLGSVSYSEASIPTSSAILSSLWSASGYLLLNLSSLSKSFLLADFLTADNILSVIAFAWASDIPLLSSTAWNTSWDTTLELALFGFI